MARPALVTGDVMTVPRVMGMVTVVVLGWALAACSAATTTPPASPSLAAGPATTAPADAISSPRPSLRYPDVQSHGNVTVEFAVPPIAPLAINLACEWVAPTEVGSFYLEDPVPLSAESVWIEFQPRGDELHLFSIGREGAAGYQAGTTTGNVRLVTASPDWASGMIRFDGLAPDPETAPAGPIPTPLADWIRPIGDDPAMATLTGTIHWTCEPAPATVPTRAPTISEAPERTMPPRPSLALIGGEHRELGVAGCGISVQIDGYSANESCGPSFEAPDDSHIVNLTAGERLHFELPSGWRVNGATVGWVTQDEAERWRHATPDTYAVVATVQAADGRTFDVAAPPPGDWTIRVEWSAARGSDTISWSTFYRVVVPG